MFLDLIFLYKVEGQIYFWKYAYIIYQPSENLIEYFMYSAISLEVVLKLKHLQELKPFLKYVLKDYAIK